MLDAIVAMQAVKIKTLGGGVPEAAANPSAPAATPTRARARASVLKFGTGAKANTTSHRLLSVTAAPTATTFNPPPLLVSSFKEGRARKIAQKQAGEWLAHNSQCLSRVYPAAKRQDSSNFSAQLCCDLWDAGVHMVALNYQTPSKALAVNEALFSLNQRCGYVLRPQYRRPGGDGGAARPPRGAHALGSPGGSVSHAPRGTLLKVRVLFATQLPKHGMQAPCVADAWDVYHPISSQFANGGAELDGLSAGDIPSPSCSLEAFGGKVCGLGEGVADATSYYDAGSSAAVPKDGLAPVWDHEFSVVCYAPESTFIMLSINRELESAPLARACVPLMALRCGYRAMPLRSPNGSALEEGSAALCHISMEPLGAAAQAPRKLRRITIALRDAGL